MRVRLLTLAMVVPAGAVPAPAGQTRGPCDALASGTPVAVSTERIGPYSTRETLAGLRLVCPDATPTLGHGFETAWAALDLGIGDLTILAGQSWLMKMLFDDPGPVPQVDWDRAPSHWVVRGCGAVLPGGVSSCGTWGEMVAAYGLEADAYAEFGPVLVSPRALAGFQLQLDVTDEVVGPIEVHRDLSRIPTSARIVEITVVGPGAAGAP